ncbi:hypothetical protein LDENG_00287690, partial [Lucifuga dentata]
MQLGRARLTPAERLCRMKAGDCLYCGQHGHVLATCPRRGSPVSVGVLVNQTKFIFPRPRLQLQATICLSNLHLPLSALIDSGADDNFLDEELARQAGIPCEALDSPLRANALDGRLLAQVKHITKPLLLLLSGNHCELIRFHLISSPQTPLVLGYPWLRKHNSQVDWSGNKITNSPILIQPDPTCQFIVEVDASEIGVGAVLSQRSPVDQKLHPCAFFSHRLTTAESNYDMGNRELLAVKLALEEWRHWLEG